MSNVCLPYPDLAFLSLIYQRKGRICVESGDQFASFLCRCCFFSLSFKSVSIFCINENIFLLNLSDNFSFINQVFLLVLPMVGERDNWISVELVLINMSTIYRLLTQLWSVSISIEISSQLFYLFLENTRESSVKYYFVGKLFVYNARLKCFVVQFISGVYR